MFFVVSKALWLAADPITLLLVCALLGALVVRRVPRTGRALTLMGVGALLVISMLPIGVLLLRPLEERFPPLPKDAVAPYGIIVLGGPISVTLSLAHGQTALEEGAARLTEAAILARRFPEAKIVYAGGGARPADPPEAIEARNLLVALGVDASRIEIETHSRNTFENARFTAALVKPNPQQTWWLVTSAWHMPRSMGLFEKAGFSVRADPVDYHSTGDDRDYLPNNEPGRGLTLFELAVHEWIGLAAYHLAGKIDAWFPGP
ncbi:MAG TPA: YdcF family protein [Roseiarcus sp.]|jgi:uncharacterized SAM-binding protein YcdF (DUF218 family)